MTDKIEDTGKVGTEGRITLSKEIRKALNVQKGTVYKATVKTEGTLEIKFTNL